MASEPKQFLLLGELTRAVTLRSRWDLSGKKRSRLFAYLLNHGFVDSNAPHPVRPLHVGLHRILRGCPGVDISQSRVNERFGKWWRVWNETAEPFHCSLPCLRDSLGSQVGVAGAVTANTFYRQLGRPDGLLDTRRRISLKKHHCRP
jgi:hypothetical protein